MEPGIFETTFPRPTPEAAFDAVAALGVRQVQFDFATAGLDSLPEAIPAGLPQRIRRAAEARGIRIAAVSGTWNMVHPDPRERERGLAGLRNVAVACRELGAPVVTLCTGTRDPESMWRRHPANGTREAWDDLLAALAAALAIADEPGVDLAIEPEPANVVATARLGRRLLGELRHPRLKVVMDPANIVASDRGRPPRAVLDDAFALLGEHTVVGHAKDLSADGAFCAAGRGIVPWDHALGLFRDAGFAGPIVLHSLAEEDAERAVGFLRAGIAEATAG